MVPSPQSHALLCRWYFKVEQSATALVCCASAEAHNTSNAVGRIDFIKPVLSISPNDTATWPNWGIVVYSEVTIFNSAQDAAPKEPIDKPSLYDVARLNAASVGGWDLGTHLCGDRCDGLGEGRAFPRLQNRETWGTHFRAD
jgi:hypothetical protein